uniref:Uncharacterized protein n=1 Tax=Setaria viridis TaxID=4556 RepID=A0A4U6T962_SETVI|nr:hypothetical protein SEVIR_9G233650v2 [Setaria viridis]
MQRHGGDPIPGLRARGGSLLLCSCVPWVWSDEGPSRRGWSSASPLPWRARSRR